MPQQNESFPRTRKPEQREPSPRSGRSQQRSLSSRTESSQISESSPVSEGLRQRQFSPRRERSQHNESFPRTRKTEKGESSPRSGMSQHSKASPRTPKPPKPTSTPRTIPLNPLDKTGLCLLSLDGGGVRGLSTLMILKRLMDKTNEEREDYGLPAVKPCQLFDLIGGTSTGGLIAIMLGRLEMSVGECIKAYTDLFATIFEKKASCLPVDVRGNIQGQFDSKKLEKSIKNVVQERNHGAMEPFRRRDDGTSRSERKCRVVVFATAVETTSVAVLRDYCLRDEDNGDNATIVEAALATSAAPTFFKPVTIDVRQYVDGGLLANNPVNKVLVEAQNIWCPNGGIGEIEAMVKCFVSIGTGNPGLDTIKKGAKPFLIKTLKNIATETERTAEDFAKQHRGLLDEERYFRYNVEQGLQGVGLAEYREQAKIEAATYAYLSNQEQKFSIRNSAKNLKIKQFSTPLAFNKIITRNKRSDANDRLAPPKPHILAPPRSREQFTGRIDLMSKIEKLMDDQDGNTRIALWGLGGTGKTRIALEAVYRRRKRSPISIFWVHAGTARRMEKDYFDIAQEVNITGWDSADPQIDKFHLVKDWLEKKMVGKWILVLDNADDIDLLYNVNRMAHYFPRSSNGTILLTTRNKKVGTKFVATHGLLEVPAFTEVESVNLLKAKISENTHERDYIMLANTLQNIPLALVQAAAFLSTEGISISEYLNLYEKSNSSKIQLLSEGFEDDLRDEDGKNPIAATFATSFEQIKKSDPRAAKILSIMSMFDTQAIPASLLPLRNNNIHSTKALGTLKAFSLITKMSPQNQTDETFDLHSLVRLSMHNWLKRSHEFNVWCSEAISCISQRFPAYSPQNRIICRSYAPHALKVLSSHETLNNPISSEDFQRASTTEEKTAFDKMKLQSNLAYYLDADKQDYVLALSIMQNSFTLAKTLLRKDCEFRAATAYLLAEMLQWQNKYKEAEEVIRQTLELRETTLGEEDEYTSALRSALTMVMIYQGKIKDGDAEDVLRQSLMSREAILGKQHPELLRKLDNLVCILGKRGKFEEAKKEAQRMLTLSEKIWGEDHSRTLYAMTRMTLILGQQSKYVEGERMARQVLELRETVFGKEHPRMLDSMDTLSLMLRGQQKWKDLKDLYQSMLKLSEKLWGKEHLKTREIYRRVLKLRVVMKTII